MSSQRRYLDHVDLWLAVGLATLAVLAMTQYQIGQQATAQATRGRLRELLKTSPSWAGDQEVRVILAEAEKLLQTKAKTPSETKQPLR